jgi:1,2-diacylglycerol 3-alpha-glucosyltransferase
MKILFVMDEFFAPNNGLSISAQRFARELRALGHDVRVLAGDFSGTPEFPLPEFCVPVFNGLIKRQGMSFARADDDKIEKAVRWCDVVYLEDCFVVSGHAARIARRLGKPCTGAFHLYPENITSSIGLQWSGLVNSAIMVGFRDYVFRYCSDIHCPTQDAADRMLQKGYTARLHVISNGVSDSFPYRRDEKPEAYRNKFIVLSVGRFSREKRQDVIIRAAASSQYRDRIHLIFAGQGPLESQYRRLARQLTDEPEFRFLSQRELADTMAVSDLYIHAAETEVEGMSCMEAMSSGLVPVIADSPRSAARHFAPDERCLFASGDADALREKMDYWLGHEAERREMEKRCSEQAQSNSVKNNAKKLERMFLQARREGGLYEYR